MSGLDILLLIFFHNRFDLFNFVDSPSYVKLKIFKNLCLLKYYEFVFYAMYFKIKTWYNQGEGILSVYINGVTSFICYVLVLLLLLLLLLRKRLSH